MRYTAGKVLRVIVDNIILCNKLRKGKDGTHTANILSSFLGVAANDSRLMI